MTPMLADAGIPMLAIMWWPLVFLFIPICAIECWVLARSRKMTFISTIKPIVKANFYSATVGYLAIWFGLIIIEMVIGFLADKSGVTIKGPFSNYLGVYFASMVVIMSPEAKFQDIVWLAIMSNLVIAYFVSVKFEEKSLRKNLPELTKAEAHKISQTMNLWSYLFLGCFWVGYLINLALTW